MVGLGYSNKEFIDTFNDTNITSFMDDDIGAIRDVHRFIINGYGWFKGDVFTEWLENVIKKKTGNKNSTFMENQDITHLTGDDFERTIYIDSLEVSETNFKIDYDTKMKLMGSGRTCTIEYFNKYDNEMIKNYSN
ncbi:hypothetical protein [Clostridium puniceum]|nr:hypothetical protein [Clostridium puniceum]